MPLSLCAAISYPIKSKLNNRFQTCRLRLLFAFRPIDDGVVIITSMLFSNGSLAGAKLSDSIFFSAVVLLFSHQMWRKINTRGTFA